MLTFQQGETKAQVLKRLEEHRKADRIVQGQYWEYVRWRRGWSGCAVGCLTESRRTPGHQRFPKLWGIPTRLAYICEDIFEGLPREEAAQWPERFISAIPEGVDLSEVVEQFQLKLSWSRTADHLLALLAATRQQLPDDKKLILPLAIDKSEPADLTA